MANEPQKPTPTKQELASEHLKKLLANLDTYAGQKGFNPFLFKKEKIDPLVAASNYDELLKIPVDVKPTVETFEVVKEMKAQVAQISKAAETKVTK